MTVIVSRFLQRKSHVSVMAQWDRRSAVDLSLSVEEFHARCGAEKPYFEYWNGEAVQKAAATSCIP